MTVSNPVRTLSLAAAGLAVSFFCACSKGTNDSPRVTPIPAQSALGGQVFSLDLSVWVTPPDGATLTFTVRSGGGTVTGSTYQNTFDRVGRWTVALTAHTDVDSADFEFVVDVVTASEAVLQAGTALALMDRGTVHLTTADIPAGSFYSPAFITVSNSQGHVDTFKGALTRGHVLYERTVGGKTDLFLFNPNAPSTIALGDDPNNETDQKFEAVSGNRVLFTSGSATDRNLYIYSVDTELTREVSALEGVSERNAFVDAAGIVYFERGPNAQRDILGYDPETDTLFEISNAAANEVIQGVVSGGGVVFSRDEGAGDIDLWYYKEGVGLTQVAADVAGSPFQDGHLVFRGSSSAGVVVFEHLVSGSDTDLYRWDPNTLTTTVVSNSAGQDLFNGATTNNKIVYTSTNGGDADVHLLDIGTGSDTDLSGNPSSDAFLAITSLNDVVMAVSGSTLRIWDDSAGSTSDVDSGGAMTLAAALPGGNVVYVKAGTGLRRWLSAGGVATVSATGTFAGPMSDGNFVVQIDAGAQDDLWFWDEAADTLTVAANDGADEQYLTSTTTNNAFVFTRLSTASKYEVHVWDPTSGVRRVSNSGLDHTHVANYELDNR